MPTFEERIEAITGENFNAASAGDTVVTHEDISQYLKDAVLDVTNRCLSMNPNESHYFTRASTARTSNGDVGGNISKIISVVRMSGTTNDWRGCTRMPLELQSRVTDVNSIHYSSKYNPSYVIDDDGAVFVYPAPAACGANSYKIYYVNETPVNSSGDALLFSHEDLNYFPNDKIYLVVIRASMSVIQALLNYNSKRDSNITIALTAINTAVDQAAVAADKFISADSDSVFGDEETFLTNSSQLTRVKNALDMAEELIDTGFTTDEDSGASDDSTPKSAGYWLNDEDSEMVQASLATAQTEIQRAQAHLAEWTSIGDMRTKEIQAALVEADGYAKEVQTRVAQRQDLMQSYISQYQLLQNQYDAAFMIPTSQNREEQ